MIKITEASYRGNLGFMEFFKFNKLADEAQKSLMRQLIAKKETNKIIDLLYDVTGIKLEPFGNSN